MTDLSNFFAGRTEQMVAFLEQLVLMESPTSSKEHVDRLGDFIAQECRVLGAEIAVYPQEDVGDFRVAVWNQNAPGKPILLLCHLDTVWPVGTLETMPFRRDDERLYGPGVIDMKAGIAISLEAIRGLVERGELPNRPIWIAFNGDEETGSKNTRVVIHELAAQVGLVLVMEPAAPGGGLKTWRKGMARYTIRVVGRASHAGNAPEAGINAVTEAAHQALYLHKLNDYQNGTSVSVTTMRAGVASNVIPPEAVMDVDVRFLKASEAERVERAIRQLSPVLPGAQVVVEGGIDRGPMERDDQMIRAFQQAQNIGLSVGLQLFEEGSGGGSDGNFTAAMGIPTLDGMGADGTGLHAAHEQVVIRSLPQRAAFLAKMLTDWDMDAV